MATKDAMVVWWQTPWITSSKTEELILKKGIWCFSSNSTDNWNLQNIQLSIWSNHTWEEKKYQSFHLRFFKKTKRPKTENAASKLPTLQELWQAIPTSLLVTRARWLQLVNKAQFQLQLTPAKTPSNSTPQLKTKFNLRTHKITFFFFFLNEYARESTMNHLALLTIWIMVFWWLVLDPKVMETIGLSKTLGGKKKKNTKDKKYERHAFILNFLFSFKTERHGDNKGELNATNALNRMWWILFVICFF